MAMIKCPECQHDISDRAEFCPHCGVPFVEKKQLNSYAYSLKMGLVSRDGFAVFFQVLAWVLWIGGLIVAISGANVVVSVDRWGDAETEFSFIQFLTLYLTYALYGGIAFGVSTVLQKFSGIYDLLYGLHLIRDDKKEEIKRITPEQIILQEELRKRQEEEALKTQRDKELDKALSERITEAAASCDEKEAAFLKDIVPVQTAAVIEKYWKSRKMDIYYPEISGWLADEVKKSDLSSDDIRNIKETLTNRILDQGGHKSAQVIRSYDAEETKRIVDELCNKTFDKKPQGYSTEEVSDFLDRICDDLEQRSNNPDLVNDNLLKREQVLNAEFSRVESGYDIKQVKSFLQEIAEKYFIQ